MCLEDAFAYAHKRKARCLPEEAPLRANELQVLSSEFNESKRLVDRMSFVYKLAQMTRHVEATWLEAPRTT